MSINEKVLGKEHPSTAADYNNLGQAYDHKGAYDKAIEYNSKALSIEKVLGKEHPSVKTMRDNLCLSLISQGQIEAAESGLPKTNWANYTDAKKAAFFNQYGVVIFGRKQYQAALNFYQFALRYLNAVHLDKSNIIWAAVYQNMAKAHCFLGNKSAALPLFEQALQYCQDDNEEAHKIKEKINSNLEECKSGK